MKKGFTMIELIFVIVILGILASVAIPRLAGTRDDAEISTAVANLRTLLSDAASYHVVKGSFGTAKWNEFTNVPLDSATAQAVPATGTAATANLKVGGKNCIGLRLVEKAGEVPAHIVFSTATGADALCTKVLGSTPVAAYYNSAVKGTNGANIPNAMAIGSNTSIYQQPTQQTPVP